MPIHLPLMISGLSEIAADYSAALCDIWGVIHDGQTVFPHVSDALQQFRKYSGPVILLSNAPRPAATVARRLTELGLSQECYDGIVTSGEVTRHLLTARGQQGQKCHHVGPEKDADLVAELAIELSDLEAADFILLSGLYDDLTETPDDYGSLLDQWHQRGLEIICANPDRIVPFGDRFIYCAGAVAERYEQKGGGVEWVGKPYPLVYQHALEVLAGLGAPTQNVLAIGDGPKTDIAGANRAGLDALFVGAGLGRNAPDYDLTQADGVAAFLALDQARAHASIDQLQW